MRIDSVEVEVRGGIDVSDGLKISQLPVSALGAQSVSVLKFNLRPASTLKFAARSGLICGSFRNPCQRPLPEILGDGYASGCADHRLELSARKMSSVLMIVETPTSVSSAPGGIC